MLWQASRRARLHGAQTVYLGVGAPLEKRRVGARVLPHCAWLQASDHDNLDELVRFIETVRAPN